MLTMSLAALVPLPPLLLEDDDFLVLLVLKNLGGYGSAFHGGGAEGWLSVLDDHEYLVYLDLIAFVFLRKTVHEQLIALFDGKLAALGLNCGLHDRKIVKKTIFRPIWQASSWLLACYSSLGLSSR